MKLTLRRISEALVACSLAVITSTVNVSASPSVTIPADQRVLKEIKLDKQLTVLKTIVLGRYAYILATSPDRMIWVWVAFLTSDGNWRAIRGHGEPIVDKPQKLFRHHRANLKFVIMILEAAMLNVKNGVENDFEEAFKRASKIISRMSGYKSHQLQRCLEVIVGTMGRFRESYGWVSTTIGISRVEEILAPFLRSISDR